MQDLKTTDRSCYNFIDLICRSKSFFLKVLSLYYCTGYLQCFGCHIFKYDSLFARSFYLGNFPLYVVYHVKVYKFCL